MAYTVYADFAGGLDRRKTQVTTMPGALYTLENAFINAGGEIEKRKTFTAVVSLPAGTHGLGFVNDTCYVFGTGADPGVSGYATYEELVPASGTPTVESIDDVSRFADKNYVTATMSDGTTRHFFDGAEVVGRQNLGVSVVPHKTKMYAADGKDLYFSAVNDPGDTVGTGSGLIDITAQDVGSTEILGIEQYYGFLGVFGQTSIQLWTMDPDPLLNVQEQVLANIGLVGRHAVGRYGTGDVLFMSHTGIRSLRARDSSNAAVLNDVGSPIDSVIAVKRATMTPTDATGIRAIVDPLTGHFWMVWGDDIYVLSLYPASKVTAWSIFKPNYTFSDVVLANARIACRVGDEILVYGTVPSAGSPWGINSPIGENAQEYDASEVTAVTPFLDAGSPDTEKHWQGIDVSCTGEWDIYINPTPDSPEAWTHIATVSSQTHDIDRIPIDVMGTHISVKFVTSDNTRAILSSFTLHHAGGESG